MKWGKPEKNSHRRLAQVLCSEKLLPHDPRVADRSYKTYRTYRTYAGLLRRFAPTIAFFLGLTFATGVRADNQKSLSSQLAEIEHEFGGRLGVAALDTGSGRRIAYRADERFPMCSTFKFLLGAGILQQGGLQALDQWLAYSQTDLLEWAPVTAKHLSDGGMSVGDLCAAAIQYSDNTAANLLLRRMGDPAKLTEYIRSLGDPVTRLDRTEPSLNTAIPGDERDTTSPASMVADLQRLLLGDQLSVAARGELDAWLAGNTTGKNRIRAGLPPDWKVGDKTGTGENGAVGDIAIVRPPGRPPILIAIYLVGSGAKIDLLEKAIARAAAIISRSFGAPNAARQRLKARQRPGEVPSQC